MGFGATPKASSLSYLLKKYIGDRRNPRLNAGGFNAVFLFNERVLRVAYLSEKETAATAAETLEDTSTTIKIWKRASEIGVTPKVHFIGLATIDDAEIASQVSNPSMEHLVIIMDKYDSCVYTYAFALAIEDKWGQLRDLVKKIIKRTWQFTTELEIGCIDVKPGNMVVNHESGGIDVRLIDLDSSFCFEVNKEYTHGAFVVAICLLALHSLKNFHINIFLPFLSNLLNDESESAETSTTNWNSKITVDAIREAYIALDTEKQAYHYFGLHKWEDFFFLATQPWPDRNHIEGLPEYYMDSYSTEPDEERCKDLMRGWGSTGFSRKRLRKQRSSY